MAQAQIANNINYVSFNLDRLGTALSFAVAAHAAILLGITFTAEINNIRTQQLEITLAQFREESNDEADYLADQNQQASGTELEKALLSSPELSEFQDVEVNQVSKMAMQQRMEESKANDANTVHTLNEAKAKVQISDRSEEKQKVETQDMLSEDELMGEIASLAAKLDQYKEEAAKRPRVRRITSVSTKRAMDALYLLKWEREIERTGNQYYPEEARTRELYGDLSLMVTVLPNGAVSNIQLLQSSGHKVLDDAAINIVEKSAPFEPFSSEMSREIDKLEIVRTWHFQKNQLDTDVRKISKAE
ncbi:MAG: energy transducer TonB [Pseudomonadales bacterium]